MGDAQQHCASKLGKCKVNPIGGDGQIDAKWMEGKHCAESTCPRLKIDICERNQDNSECDDGRQVCPVSHYII